MSTWQDFQLESAPAWLQKGTGEAWLRGVGDEKDEIETCAKDAVKARLPALSPIDALYRMAGERGLTRGASESVESFRARVVDAWDTWLWAGTAKGVLLALRGAGYTGEMWIVSGTGRYHRMSYTGWYSWGEYTLGPGVMPVNFWNGFRVVFQDTQWSSALPAAGSDEVTNLRRLVMQWKSSFALFEGFVVRPLDGNIYPLWGLPRVYSSSIRTWSSGAGTDKTWNYSIPYAVGQVVTWPGEA